MLRRLFVLVVLAGGCSAPPLPEGEPIPEEALALPYAPSLGGNDIVRVTVFGHPELSSLESGDRVDADGVLQVALVGPVPVAGMTPVEAAARIETELGRYVKTPSVTVSVVEHASRQFFLAGEFVTPGPFVLDRPMTVLQAASLGGGFQVGADREQAVLLRDDGGELFVHFFNLETPGLDGLAYVQPNDLIFVRMSGAGSFRDQVLPILQGVAPPLNALSGLIIVTDRLNSN